MHVFISAGEPSGDLHAASLATAISKQIPNARISGFGGPHMTAAGVKLLYPLTELAVMWFGRVLANLPTFFRVAKQAEDYFKDEKPDAVVIIDYPGFHWHIAKRAKAAGIPCYYFVPPQLWAWAGWRVKKMRNTVDAVLTALPFEETWYAERGVNTHYVGHPYFDELSKQKLDAAFVLEQRAKSGKAIALLPGSRTQEVTGNFSLMLATATKIHTARPDTRFLVAAFNEKQATLIRETLKESKLPVEVHVGRTPEIIELAEACVAVSGSVGLEMLYRRKPAVIVYRISKFARTVSRFFIKCKYISLVNLLADEELYPEYLTTRDESTAMANDVLTWLNDTGAKADITAKLTALRNRVAIPGACERAANFLMLKHGLKRKAA
ncbi:lipid-A-disaccharide synthase [soil metagenome]